MLSSTAQTAATVQFPPAIIFSLPIANASQANGAIPLPPPFLTLPSDFRPADHIVGPLALSPQRPNQPSPTWLDEQLDWDYWVDVASTRPTGTLTVNLVFAGRGVPMPVEDPWE